MKRRTVILAVAAAVLVVGVVVALCLMIGGGPGRAEQSRQARAPGASAGASGASRPAAAARHSKASAERRGIESVPPGSHGNGAAMEETPPPPRDDAAAIVARVTDASRPLAERRAEVEALAAAGDARSVEALMAIGEGERYLSFAAVGALGSVDDPALRPRIATYLRKRLAAQDLKVLSAAITSYAELMGKAAVPELVQVIRRNRVRGDGFEEMVLTAAVDALGRIASAEAAPVLIEELGRSTARGWSLEYGSRVVQALGELNAPEGREALLAYAAGLEARRPDDPLAGPHFDEKIAEARRAAGQ